MLENFLQSAPKEFSKIHRSLQINNRFNVKILNLFGSANLGKTDFALKSAENFLINSNEIDKNKQNAQDSIKKTKILENEILYINCEDPRIEKIPKTSEITNFCALKKISFLIIDNCTQNLAQELQNLNQADLAALPQSILLSKTPLFDKIDSMQNSLFTNFQAPPITFSEFCKIHKISPQNALSSFIKSGGGFVALNDFERGIIWKNFSENEVNFAIFKAFARAQGNKITAFQIYTKIKKSENLALSKDRFYASVENFKKSGAINLVEKFEHENAPKKLFFNDFSAPNALRFERNFGALFENMIFNELHAKNTKIYYTDRLDFYLQNEQAGIICAPFYEENAIKNRLNKIQKEREFCEKFIILCLNPPEFYENEFENLGTPCFIKTFSEFANTL